MPITKNGYYNDPGLAAVAEGITGMFAPPSQQDIYAAAKARETNQRVQGLSELYGVLNDPAVPQDAKDRAMVGLGLYTPNQSYYSVDQGNATDLAKNAADNKRAILTNEADNRRAFAQTRYGALGQGQALPELPPSVADMFGLPATGVVSGPAKPLTESEAKGQTFLGLPEDDRKAAVLSDIPVEQIIMGGQPKIVRRSDAVNQTPVPKDSGLAITTNPDGTVSVTQGGAGTNGKLTEVQGKYALFATRADEANKVMNDILASPYGAQLPSLDYIAGMAKTDSPTMQVLYNNMKSPEGRQYYQAAENFMTTILRPDTGAAVTPQEFQTYARIFIPTPGDDPTTIANKNQARRTAAVALQALSNGGAAQIAKLMADNGLPVPPELAKYVQASPQPAAPAAPAASGIPQGVDPNLWSHMTAEEKALWQN